MSISSFRRRPGLSARRRTTCRPLFEHLEDRLVPTTFTVTTNADDGLGSLRQAILAANNTAGTNAIVFHFSTNIVLPPAKPGVVSIVLGGGPTEVIGTPGQVYVIEPVHRLPTITHKLIINGAVDGFGLTGPVPGVEIRGDLCGAGNSGLYFQNASGSQVSGLIINSFERGIKIDASSNVAVSDCYLGITLPHTTATGNQSGLTIVNGSTGTSVGDCVIANNVLSGVEDDSSDGATFSGDVIADDSTGIWLLNSGHNRVGVAGPTLGNLINNNRSSGVLIQQLQSTPWGTRRATPWPTTRSATTVWACWSPARRKTR